METAHDRIMDYLEQRFRAFVLGEGNVPCGDCRGCCRAGYVIGLSDAEAAELEHTDINVDGAVHHVIMPLADGRCPNLTEDLRCAVYEKRPVSCRQYDCRDMALASIRLESIRPGVDEINASIQRHYREFGGAIVVMAKQAEAYIKSGANGVAASQNAMMAGLIQLLPPEKVEQIGAKLLSPDEDQRAAACKACDVHRGQG